MEITTQSIRDEDLSGVVATLMRLGLEYGFSYPWHSTADPFRLLVAEFLLRRTTRTAVARAYEKIFDRYPTAHEMARASTEDLREVAREVGLRQRTLRLIDIAQRVERWGEVLPYRDELLTLPYVGPYIADAVLLYSFDERTFPLDNNVRRVLYRVMRGEHPPTRMEPYRDATTERMVMSLTKDLDVSQLRHLHQGVMVVAWEVCRSSPICQACALRELCLYSRKVSKTVL